LRRLCRPIVSGVVATGIALLLLRYTGEWRAGYAQSTAPTAQIAQPASNPAASEVFGAEGLSRAFRRAAQKVLPAVVVVKAGPSPVCPRCGRAHEAGEEGDDEELPDAGRPRSLEILGSGFIVAPTGIVLTNKHVVKGNPKLVVQTADGKEFPVTQISEDREYDAAVLRIEAKAPLPFVRLGNSEAAEIGDWVLTIGCPLELDQTVSAGIISAKNRSFCTQHHAKYLQTDAVVNPGSSGGPLVALNGTVIGITSSIASDDGGYQGIGFAVPASLVKPLLAKFGEAPVKASVAGEPAPN
jgi:serine protease Do